MLLCWAICYKIANYSYFSLSVDPDTAKLKAWWKNRKIRMNLCQIYHSEGMLEDFANTALQLVLKWVWRRTVIYLYLKWFGMRSHKIIMQTKL